MWENVKNKDPDGAERGFEERGLGKGTAGAFGACGATQATLYQGYS